MTIFDGEIEPKDIIEKVGCFDDELIVDWLQRIAIDDGTGKCLLEADGVIEFIKDILSTN